MSRSSLSKAHVARRTIRAPGARSAWWAACLAVLLSAVVTAENSPRSKTTFDLSSPAAAPPAGSLESQPRPRITAAEQGRISGTIGADDPAYHALAAGRGYSMKNAAHEISADFTAGGVEFARGGDRWRMTLRGYGYGDAMHAARAARPIATANRTEYRRGALTEWYLNGPLGLEQGFTLEEAPGASNGNPLTLAFTLSGTLTPSVEPGGRAVILRNRERAAMRYTGLTAWDATGRELESWLVISGAQMRLRVDDTGARYPLTIDPFVQAHKLTTARPCPDGGVCDEGAANEAFGGSVAISGDGSTIVVGVPQRKVGDYQTGTAYVFLRPEAQTGGWDNPSPLYFAVRLYRSDGVFHNGLAPMPGNFGHSVDVDYDGSTIVVGDPNYIRARSFVYVRPATGWARTVPMRENGSFEASYYTFNSQFGHSVAISGDGNTVAVGAPQKCVRYAGSCVVQNGGAIYVYVKPAEGWIGVNATQNAELKPASAMQQLFLGWAVAIDNEGKTIAGSSADGLFVFTKPSSWYDSNPTARLTASSPPRATSVAISSDGATIVAGAQGISAAGTLGVAYLYERPATGWVNATEMARLTPSDPSWNDKFGYSVNISGDARTVVAGAVSGNNPPFSAGAVYVFAKPANGWLTSTETFKIMASDGMAGNYFGSSTAITDDGTTLVVGAPLTAIGDKPAQGAAYLFTGSAHTPIASVDPSSLAFGSQPAGTTSSAQLVTVTNTGSAPLNVTSVSVSGPFAASQNCPSASPLAPGASCSESVVFSPTAAGPATGTLTFTDNSGGTPGATQQVQLQGIGTRASTSTSIVSVSPNTVFVGQPVTVSYTVAAAAGNALTPSGTVTVAASTGESCTGSAPAGSCDITFSTPTNAAIAATYSGDSAFDPSTSSTSPVRVVDFSLSAAPASQTARGRKVTYSLTISAQNGLTGAVSLACSGGPANATCAMSPGTVTLSASPVTAKATVTLPNRAPGGTYTITLTGTIGNVTRSTTVTLVVP